MTPIFSIVTGTRNRAESYSRFVASLAATCQYPTELIVADASDDQHFGYSRSVGAGLIDKGKLEIVRVLYERPRLGVVKGYNVAFRHAVGKYVVWFNDDCECLPGWQQKAAEFMDAHPEVGIGAIYFKDVGSNERFYVQEWPRRGVVFANFGVVRREVGEQVGWFDEAIGNEMYGCDNSIALNAIMADYAVVQIPDCKVLHYRVQDAVRQDNMHRLVNGAEVGDGNKLMLKWANEAGQGWANLLAKVKKYEHLIGPIYID